MSAYLVIFTEPGKSSAAAIDRIQKKWPDRYFMLSDQIVFVAPEEPTLIKTVRDTAGMISSDEVSGLVLETNYGAIDGWEIAELWEWIRKHT